MACGLANRMFQYCYYLWGKKEGFEASVDFFTTKRLAHEEVNWSKIFPHAPYKLASPLKVFILGGGSSFLNRLRRKFLRKSTKVIETSGAFEAFLPYNQKDAYMMGVFQNAKMVEQLGNLSEIFAFPELEGERNIGLSKRLKYENSVAIHVRKGKDYQTRIWYQNTCPVEFYEKAIAYIKNHVENPKFYVFTDNPAWVRENLKGFEYELVEGNPGSGWGSHFDMQLMTLCHHNIISNSTYSWWGAYLNQNTDKIVICPKVWFNPSSCNEHNSDRLLCKNWIAI